MSTRAVKFNIDLTANPRAARQLETALKRVGQTGRQAGRDIDKGFSDPLATMSKLKGAIAGLGAGMVMRTFVRNTMEAEHALAQLDAILKSTGNAAGYNREQLLAMTADFARNTTHSTNEIIEAQTRLLSYSAIVGENYPRALQLVIDQSVRLGETITQSAETVGKALEYPAEGVSALTRQGFRFSDSQKELLKQLEATGRLAEAQAIVMDVMEESYIGAAKAARETFGGAISGLKNALETLLTGDVSGGGLRGTTSAINDLTETLNDPQLQQGFQTLITGALQAIGVLARWASTTASVAKFIGEEIAARVHGPEATDTVRVEQRIERLKQTLKGLDAVDQRGAFAWLSPDFLKSSEFKPSDFVKPVEEVRARLQAELDKEEAKLRVGVEFNEAAARRLLEEANAPIVTPTLGDLPTPKGDGKKKKTDAEREAERLLQLYERTSEALRRQVALFNDNSESAGLLYDLQHGALRDLQPEQKARLEGLGMQLQALRALADMEAKRAEARKEAEREAQALIEATYTAEERYQQQVARAQYLHAMGLLSLEQRNRVIEDATKRLADATKSATAQFEEFGLQAARNLQTTFADLFYDIDQGFDGLLRGFLDVLRRMLSEAMSAQLLKALFGRLDGAADGKDGSFWGMVRGFLGSFGGGSAKVPFANGGIVKGPITFPMANGQFGLMGEAGPEAIMPLRRGPGGRLGVDASAGGQAPDVHIRQILVADRADLADYVFSAQNERVIVQYLDRLGFGGRN